jgi:hypothetical protein
VKEIFKSKVAYIAHDITVIFERGYVEWGIHTLKYFFDGGGFR